MKHNNMEQQLENDINIIETSKNKYFLIGFVLGCIPFIIIIIFLKTFSNNDINALIEILIITALITAIINAFTLKQFVYQRLINFFNIKYNIDYQHVKKSF